MFARRALTAAVLLAGLLAATFLLPPAGFALIIALIIGLGAHEWALLCGLTSVRAFGYGVGCAAAYLGCAAGLRPWLAASPSLLAIMTATAVFWMAIAPLWLRAGVSRVARPWLRAAGAVVLLPAGLAMSATAPVWLLALLGLVWIADTAAYAAGRAFGRHRLAPSISPGKTWEGVVGGALGCLAYAIILASAWPEVGRRAAGVGWSAYLAGVCVLCALCVVGDLFESAVKRQAGVKDSGSLLPGHGGVLDRIDSATAVLPVGMLLVAWSDVA